VRDRHARWYLELSANARAGLRGRAGPEWRSRIATNWDNLRAALDWYAERGDAESACTVVDGVAWSWFARNDPHEAVRWLGDALRVPGGTDTAVRAMVVTWHAYFAAQIFGPSNERAELLQAVEELRAGTDRRRLADALMILAELCNRSEETELSQEAVDEAHPVLTELDDEWGLAIWESLTARNLALLGRLDEAADHAQRSADRLQAIGEEWLIFEGLGLLAILLEIRGDLDAAADAYVDMQARCQALGLPLYETQWTVRLAAVRARQGDDAAADQLFAEFIEGEPIPAGLGWALIGRAGSVHRLGHQEQAREYLDEALRLYEMLANDSGCTMALAGLCWWALRTGDHDAAATFAKEAQARAANVPADFMTLIADTAAAAVDAVVSGDAEARDRFTALVARRKDSGGGHYVALIGGTVGAHLDEPEVAALLRSFAV
jgi:tetratricopeptide (TPR) repeat protein